MKEYTPAQWWHVWGIVWEHITNNYACKMLVAPEPPNSGYYWCKTLKGKTWDIWDYHSPTGMWYPTGSDYGVSTLEGAIIEWQGPLVPPS